MAIYSRNEQGQLEEVIFPILKGEDGITPNIQIGTVTTLEAGEQATVTNSGTLENPIFDFGIPKGQDGTGGSNVSTEEIIQATENYIQEKIDDGTIANLAIANESITSDKIAINSISPEKTSFLNILSYNYFEHPEALMNKKIVASNPYEIIDDNSYMISAFIPLVNSTTPIQLYSYGRISFFDQNKDYLDSLGAYNTSNTTNIDLSSYPSLANSKFIKVCARKEYINSMIISQEDVIINGEKNEVVFDNLALTRNQSDSILSNLEDSSIPINKINGIIQGGIKYHDGYKIAAHGDNGYIIGSFNLVPNISMTSTDLISIDANLTSTWKFKNISRISFFDSNKTYIDSLYNGSAPSDAFNLFATYSSLVNSKYVALSINLQNKEDWSLLIDDVEYNAEKEVVSLPSLIIEKSNLSEDIKNDLTMIEDNSFKSHKDTSIVFAKNKDFSSTHFRIPFMCVTNLGTIIAGCDIRYKSSNDHSLIDLGTARSIDGGKTWIDKTVAIPNPGTSSTLSRVMDGTILATKEGRVFLIGNKFNDGNTNWTNVATPNDPNWDCVLYHSDDDGRTWEFNQSLKPLLPEGQISFLGGVGSGIQMKNGTLVFPIQVARADDNPFNCQSGIIYSTDNGQNWTMGESLVNEYTSECSIVEYPTGTIMINCRQEGQNHRSVFKTTNLGTTWEETPMNTGTQQTNACQGHMCKVKVGFDKEVVLFTNPINDGTNREDGAKSGYDRSNLSLSILQNDSKFTPIYTLYRPHSDGYSCMAFDERKNRLYVVMELEYNLVFKDITDLLPTIQLYKNLETI